MSRRRPTLPEEVFLLALRDNGSVSAHYLTYAFGGAILAELMMQGRLGVSGSGRKARVAVLDPSPTHSTLLNQCLDNVRRSRRPRRLSAWVTAFARTRKLKHEVARSLCARGVVRAKDAQFLFVFRRRLYPLMDRRCRRELVERTWSAINDRDDVEPRTACLVAIAASVHLLRVAFGGKRIRPHKARIKEIARNDPIGTAVRQAVSAAAAAATSSTGAVVAAPTST